MNEHTKTCDCANCAKARMKAFADRLVSLAKLGDKDGIVRLPITTDQTVFVRAHFKRSPNHLRKFPRTLSLFRKALKGAI